MIHRREMHILHGQTSSIQNNGAIFIIDPVKKEAAFQTKLRILLDQLAFYLKLDNGNGLVHTQIQFLFSGTAWMASL